MRRLPKTASDELKQLVGLLESERGAQVIDELMRANLAYLVMDAIPIEEIISELEERGELEEVYEYCRSIASNDAILTAAKDLELRYLLTELVGVPYHSTKNELAEAILNLTL